MNFWRRCSACKKEISLGGKYYICSVTGCNKKSRPTQYCTVSCWDAHNAVLRHRDGGALELKAPLTPDTSGEPKLIRSNEPFAQINNNSSAQDLEDNVLVVVSKMKKYIFDKSQMNTSADIMPLLSQILRQVADQAIINARREGRKTVLDRDIPSINNF